MKKIFYYTLAIGIIFTACKKEEESNNPPAPSLSIVGVWTPTSVDIDSSITVSIAGFVIDSLSGTGSVTSTPEEFDLDGDIEFTNNGKMLMEEDTLDYIYSNNDLTLTDEDSTFTVSCSLTQTNLSIDFYEMDTSFVDMGFSVSMYYKMTINCSRNTIKTTNIEQRLGKPNNWFINPTVDKYFKDIKFNK